MRALLFTILTLSFVISCKNVQQKAELQKETIQSEIIQKEVCDFNHPDTSISGILLRNAESTSKIIGLKNYMDSLGQYHFFSKKGDEYLTLIQYPGDESNVISMVKLEPSVSKSKDDKKLNIEKFKTEKGIMLGMAKNELTNILGKCYAMVDSTAEKIVLQYRIEYPKDSDSKYLTRNNMPIYYGRYVFSNDKLLLIEFGFENP